MIYFQGTMDGSDGRDGVGFHRGKSGLQRADRQVMPGRYSWVMGEVTESATEKKPPVVLRTAGKGEKAR